MPKPKFSWNDLLRYSKGEGTQQERKAIEGWIAQQPDGNEIVSFLSKTEHTQAEEKQVWDVDTAWESFNATYNMDAIEPVKEKAHLRSHGTSPGTRNSYSKTRKSFNLRYAVAAAVLVIVALFGMQYFLFTDGIFPQEQVYVANNGERVQVEMKDGTHITLNSGSKMWVLATDSERNVRLNGQAFFDVASDPDRPFKVMTERATTKVLGTRFEVKAYPDTEDISVTVEHGKVQFTPNDEDSASKGLILVQDQIGYLHTNGSISRKIVKNAEEYIGWKNGELQFNDLSLKEVVSTLERNYDVDISIKEENKTNSEVGGFTGSFSEKQPITEVLDAITMVLNLNYQQSKSDDSYILFK